MQLKKIIPFMALFAIGTHALPKVAKGKRYSIQSVRESFPDSQVLVSVPSAPLYHPTPPLTKAGGAVWRRPPTTPTKAGGGVWNLPPTPTKAGGGVWNLPHKNVSANYLYCTKSVILNNQPDTPGSMRTKPQVSKLREEMTLAQLGVVMLRVFLGLIRLEKARPIFFIKTTNP